MKPLVIVILFAICCTCKSIVVGRQDTNYDLVLYMNGKPLQASSLLQMPAFQQVSSVTLANGQVVSPTLQMVNGQMQIVPTPVGVSNLVVNVQRSNSLYGLDTNTPNYYSAGK